MNVEIVAEAALFPEKEYINGIFVTVHIESRFFCPPYWHTTCSGLETLWCRSGSHGLSDRIINQIRLRIPPLNCRNRNKVVCIFQNVDVNRSSKALLSFFPFPNYFNYFMASLATFPDLKLMDTYRQAPIKRNSWLIIEHLIQFDM